MQDGGNVFRGAFRILRLEAAQQFTMRSGERPKPSSALGQTT